MSKKRIVSFFFFWSVYPFIHQVIEPELQLVSICILLSEVLENSTSLSLEKTYNKF